MSAPTYALADKLVAWLRGFDMGDDAVKLEECEALAEEEDGLSAWGWCLYGVLLWRAGRHAEAAQPFRAAAERGESPLTCRLLAALSALRGGEAEAALAELDALIASGEQDDDVGPLRLQVARGHALRALERADEAAQAYVAASEHDATRAEPWSELGRLQLARGDAAAAIEALAKALELDGDDHVTAFLLAALRAQAGEVEGALGALEAALHWETSYKARAREDARFAALLGSERFEALTAPPPPPDLSWLDRFPSLAALLAQAEALGLTFLSEEEAVKGGEALVDTFTGNYTLGMLWNDALFEACGQAAQGKLRVADAPTIWHRNGYEIAGGLYLDPEAPDTLHFLPGPNVPPAFFHELAPTPEAVSALLAHYYPAKRRGTTELSRHVRLFMGYSEQLQVVHPYSGTLVPIDFHEMDRHLVFSPFLDALCWGTAFKEDPWPERIPPQPGYGIKIGNASRDMRRQLEGGNCRFTRRALFSRSLVGYELHQSNLWVWDIRYDPNPFPELIERLNAIIGTALPTDLPFDVCGAMLGFDFMPASELEGTLAELDDPQSVPAYLRVIAALRHSEPEVLGLLRRYLHDEDIDVRASVANLCLRYDWLGLLEDLAVLEPDPELEAQLLSVLEQGIAPPEYTELGEPVGYWESQDAYDDDEYEEDGE
ncbi:MAG: hypothetical protein H6741_16390 [Alphaproteobacteria bacterium]|nr:hypothetical protein [Alphaproteobacteria bacterium]